MHFLARCRRFWVDEPNDDQAEYDRRDAILQAEYAAAERLAFPIALVMAAIVGTRIWALLFAAWLRMRGVAP